MLAGQIGYQTNLVIKRKEKKPYKQNELVGQATFQSLGQLVTQCHLPDPLFAYVQGAG